MLHILRNICEQPLTVGTFETVEEADRAKDALNGADIYSGCCTLKVEWGKVCSHSVDFGSDCPVSLSLSVLMAIFWVNLG